MLQMDGDVNSPAFYPLAIFISSRHLARHFLPGL